MNKGHFSVRDAKDEVKLAVVINFQYVAGSAPASS